MWLLCIALRGNDDYLKSTLTNSSLLVTMLEAQKGEGDGDEVSTISFRF